MAKQVEAAHILVKTEEEAKIVLTQIMYANKSFEDAAKEKSLCPSKKKGGSLGWFGRGQMVKEFENACFNGKKGDLIGPIKTQFGWHIIKIVDSK